MDVWTKFDEGRSRHSWVIELILAHLTLVTLTFDPVTPLSIGFLCYPRWMCGVWTKFEEGTSRRP